MDFDISLIGLGALVGLSLGLTGSGGSILALPLLIYGAKIPMEQALVLSLLVVGCIATFGAVRQTIAHKSDWAAAIQFSLAGMILSPIVLRLAEGVNETVRLSLFALLMFIVAWFMMKPFPFQMKSTPLNPKRLSSLLLIAAGGGVTGVLTGFFGVGGGFIIVPLLNMIFAMPYSKAVGTSLAVIAMISFSALAGHLVDSVALDLNILIPFVAGGALGILMGVFATNRIPERVARSIFALTTASFATFILIDTFLLN